MSKRVLIVDDDKNVCRLLTRMLEKYGITPDSCDTIDTAVALCEANKFDLIMLDYHIGDGGIGWKLAEQAKTILNQPAKVIGMSGTVNFDTPETEAFSKNYFDTFMEKPFDLAELKATLEDFLGL